VSTGMHGVDVFENLPTGITPDGKIVPMEHAADHDNVDILYRKRKLWTAIPNSPFGTETVRVSTDDIVRALEAASAKRLTNFRLVRTLWTHYSNDAVTASSLRMMIAPNSAFNDYFAGDF
jgi:hypothetical protein